VMQSPRAGHETAPNKNWLRPGAESDTTLNQCAAES
jgi:hypothetical protein